ncbi:uncharacterized protein LOC119671680 [Teleopsis dalmanni]|uniref:uncharacterized protein LOC119671680 n=1 Tax=Teleopsis dalmanni TaxID=139649 RepID=UPI0018CE681A|nr:uncharacterized protein LOC119671680 [Teleopsis dalmanni]
MSNFEKEIVDDFFKSLDNVAINLHSKKKISSEINNVELKKQPEQQLVNVVDVKGVDDPGISQVVVNSDKVSEVKPLVGAEIELTTPVTDMKPGAEHGIIPKTNLGVKVNDSKVKVSVAVNPRVEKKVVLEINNMKLEDQSEQQLVNVDAKGSTYPEAQKVVNSDEVLKVKPLLIEEIELTTPAATAKPGIRSGVEHGAIPKTNFGVKVKNSKVEVSTVKNIVSNDSSSSSTSDIDITETTAEMLYVRCLYNRLSIVMDDFNEMKEIVSGRDRFDEDKFINSCRFFDFSAKSFYNYLLKARDIISESKFKNFKVMLDEYFSLNLLLRKRVLTKSNIKLTDKLKVYLTSNEKDFERKNWTQVHREKTHIILREDDLQKTMIELANLIDCLVEIQGISQTLYIRDCTNTVFLCGPTVKSAFVKDCYKCTLFLACKRLKIENCKRCDFYVQVVQDTTLEHSKNIRFGYYEYCYPKIESDFKKARLCMYDEGSSVINDLSYEESKPPNWSYFDDLGDRPTSKEFKMKVIAGLRQDTEIIDDEAPFICVPGAETNPELFDVKSIGQTTIPKIGSVADNTSITKNAVFFEELAKQKSGITIPLSSSQVKDNNLTIFDNPATSVKQVQTKHSQTVDMVGSKKTAIDKDKFSDTLNASPIVPNLFAVENKENRGINKDLAIKEQKQSKAILSSNDSLHIDPTRKDT